MTKRNRAQLINSLMDCTNIQSGIDDDEKNRGCLEINDSFPK